MTSSIPFPTDARLAPLPPLYFAGRASRELDDGDFDDAADDFDDFRKKRPRRRPFLRFMLVLLVIAGVWYVTADSRTRAALISRVTSAIEATVHAGLSAFAPQPDLADTAFAPPPVPIPVFHEGQHVTITSTGETPARLLLRHDSDGAPHGPSVDPDERLTVTDGRLVEQRWMYSVRTQAGASGWVAEQSLRPAF